MALPFQVRKDYKYNTTSANALFSGAGVRVESASLGKQFNDNAYIGTNTQGQLHRDEVSDFTGQSNYVVKQEKANGVIYAHIIFYRSVPTRPYAEYIGLDPLSIITNLDMNDYAATSGQWTNLSFSTSSGRVERQSGSTTVTFTFDTEKATINLQPSSSFPQNMRVDGSFIYIGGVDLAANAINANWNQDRVTFYKEETYIDRNWVCYFMPNDGARLPESSGIGVFKGVTWTKTQ